MSVEYIDALNNENSKKKYAIIGLDDLCLDKRNPRFSSSTIIGNKREINEIDIIEYLLRFGKIVELAESIDNNNGLYDEEWISCYKNNENEIIVLEGNRRVAACKMLKDPSILSDEIRERIRIPSVDKDKTLPNILKLKAIIYDNESDAQNYIAAKHTKPEVKKWETVEQCNYYYEQFINGIQPTQIAARVGEDVKKVREKIKQFGLFKKVFSVVNEQYPMLLVEEVNILPLVTKFLPPLISNKGKMGLNLRYDEEKLIYLEAPEKKMIFTEILLKIGEAFFVRPKLRGADTLERETSDRYRISTDEIKSRVKVETLILEDIRIPGLYDLIIKYQETKGIVVEQPIEAITSNDNLAVNSDSEKNIGCKQEHVKYDSMGAIPQFFSDIDYSRIDVNSSVGLVLVCEEIKKISTYYGGNAYKQFPIAASFLLRSLIEQVLAERLKQIGRYESMVNQRQGRSSRSPELGVMIEYFLKDYRNGNLSLFWNDRNLAKEFNQCFSGYGTKDQLDTIIHNPHLIQPDQNFLNSLAKQGLKRVVQGFLNEL